MTQPSVTWHRNGNYNPWEDQVDAYTRCGVCGFWIDEERTTESERFGAMALTSSGSTYHPGAGGDYTTKDKTTYTTVAAYGACPFCGSGNWRQANGPEGLRL